MLHFSPFRTAIIAVVAVLGILFTIPNFLTKDQLAAWPGFLPSKTMVLGLDLQGGSHLLLQVNRDDIINERIKELRKEARSALTDKGIGNIITTSGKALTIELVDPTRLSDAEAALKSIQTNISQTVLGVGGVAETEQSVTPDGKITLTLTDKGIDERMSSLVSQSIEVIRKRVDELGTTEPSIQRQGSDRVLVQVPGFNDSARLKDIISRTARLTFHLVYPNMTAAQAKAQGLPAGTEILPSKDGGEELIYEDIALGGESLTNAEPGFDQQTSQPIVTFRFDTQGAIKFGELTSAHVGQRFAVVLDNQVITAPVIRQPITGGTGQISGSFTTASANDLAVLLRAGALPATLDIIEERSVGPSLGADSIRAGVIAGLIGAIAVVVFMVLAYGLFGLFADISLVLNVVLILGALSMLGATLTLPGIAGIVLTIGMAVDANVLIYERIREEMAAGRTLVQSIEAGFQRAMATIVDANVTTLIAAVVLFFMGSGPVQGFAVTLALGILTTMFTAYLVSLFIIGRWYAFVRPKKLRLQVFRFVPDNTKIPFMAWRKIAITGSVLASIASLALFGVHGLNLGIDFKGGSALTIESTTGPADAGEIRAKLNTLGLGDVQVQGFGKPEDVLVRIGAQPGGDTAQQEAVKKVSDALGADSFKILSTDVVGPTVSGELAVAGAIAVGVALLGVLIYLWFRFEWQFAVGALIATMHDVIMTIGFFSLTGIEFNLSSIAAVLTIVGYSLNDTVVVYDRVREWLKKFRRMPLPELIDDSINSTLSRTTLTSFTTLLALLALVFFGGEVIRSFTLSMTFGVLIGTYSSIFIAAPILILFRLKSRAEVARDEKVKEKRTDGAAV
ncbi:MAG TPA: protein translocase subunit SecD [Devosiaceae bacterium]